MEYSSVSQLEPAAPLAALAGRRGASRWLLLAQCMWLLVALLAVALFLLGRLLPPLPGAHPVGGGEPHVLLHDILPLSFACVYSAAGAVIFWRKRDDWMALLVSLMLVAFGTLTFMGSPLGISALPPAAGLAALLIETFGQVMVGLFFYFFPDGRFMPRWTMVCGALWVIWQLPGTLLRGSVFDASTWPEPLFWLAVLGALASFVLAQVLRYRRTSSPTQRQQTKWVVYGITLGLLGFAVSNVVRSQLPFQAALVPRVLMLLFMMAIPLAICAATLRSRLWDIDPLINRTLVYGVLSLLVIGLYVLLIGGLGLLLAPGPALSSLAASAMVAVLFHPLRLRLQQGVNRLLYGERDDPYLALSRLGQRLEATMVPEAVLPTLVESIAQALRLPYVVIQLTGAAADLRPISYGTPPPALAADACLILPLSHGQQLLGQLLVVPRSPGEPFGPADRRLLADLARQAGVAVHALRLSIDLQRSRERLVSAREEERRRLRRDLHDGLGPELASHTLKLEAARDLLSVAPQRAEQLLGSLIGQSQQMIAEIRRLVYALRPPALDDLGLLRAVQEQVSQYQQPGLSIVVVAPDGLPPLPAAVEVAAYRIIQEALTNVLKHAQASTCTLQLTLLGSDSQRRLLLEVRDDGVGLPPLPRAGVGLHSLRERAEELGGQCLVAALPFGGTCVRALLPAPAGKE